jgi:putative cell wall-binding protein
MRARCLLIALALLGVLAGPGAAQPLGGALAGTVTDVEGAPLGGIEVRVVDADCAQRCEPIARVTTGDDGAWRAEGVAPGPYVVAFRDPAERHGAQWFDGASARADAEVVEVDVDETAAGIDARLPPPAAVAGAVRGPAGEPLVDAQVRVPALDVATTTDPEGRYRLGGLPPGATVLEVTPAQAALAPVAPQVRLAAGQATTLDVQLPAAALPVERLAGDGRVATAVLAARRGWPDGAQTVVVAAAGSFADALAAAPLAAAHDAPLLLVDERTPQLVLAEVARLGAREAIVVGAVGVVPFVVQAELTRAGLTVRRIAGEARFDTAALVAREVGAPSGTVVVAAGRAFADAVAAAPVAAQLGLPVLLAERDALTPDTAAAVGDLGAQQAIVLGGLAVLDDAVAAALPAPQRVSGTDRYGTAAAVATFGLERGVEARIVYVATGRAFPDALAAGPLAARRAAWSCSWRATTAPVPARPTTSSRSTSPRSSRSSCSAARPP